jgi:hypothetical protein
VTVTPFLVLVTGHAAAGKTTVAPRLAGELGAIWISRDTIHAKVYSGWEPEHPALTSDHYDPEIGANTYFEGKVVWDVFLWMLTTVAPHHPVVADTPFNHPWNREMFGEASATWDFPVTTSRTGRSSTPPELSRSTQPTWTTSTLLRSRLPSEHCSATGHLTEKRDRAC